MTEKPSYEELEKRVLELEQAESERKRIEEALQRIEDEMGAILDATTETMILIDYQGVVIVVNQITCKRLGIKKEDLIGHCIYDFFPPEVAENRRRKYEAVFDTGKPVRFEDNRAGRIFNQNVYPVFGDKGRVEKVAVFASDITERKQTEEALVESKMRLAESNQLLTGVLEHTHILTAFLDPQFNFIWVNHAYAAAGKNETSFFPGKNHFDLYPHEENQAIFQRVLDTGEPFFVSAKPFEYPDQPERGVTYWDWSLIPVKDDTGKVNGLVFTLAEVTERKRAEEALRESEEKLNRSKKMEAMGLLAGGVAHDLNNVLSGIVSFPELILMDLPEDSKLRKPIETMQESGHRAAAIVQDLLTVARGVATTKEPLNLNDLIGDYLNSPEFKKLEQFHPTVTVKTNLDTDLLKIGGSPVNIRKVAMNLVSNASEAIEGSGNVTISTVNRYVDRPLRGYDDVAIGEYAILSVSDDGSGISSSDLDRVFEPFYTKKVMGRSGTGLGLTVAWNVVRDHKGYIDVTSDENGTTFELYFPITRDEISDKDLSIPIKDYKGNGETILVVDDMESQRYISCKMLDTLGYKTKSVSSGEEAVEYLKENSVDLLLLDMIMDPGINGRETYERIIKIHPNQKAIIVSGFVETDEVKEAQKLGAGKYIKKPITLEKTGLAVKEELEK